MAASPTDTPAAESRRASEALNPEPANVRNTYWITVGVLDSAYGLTKEAVQEAFKGYGIDGRPFFYEELQRLLALVFASPHP